MRSSVRSRLFSKIGVRLAVGFITLLLMLASLAVYSSVAGRRALAEGVGLASEAIAESLSSSLDRMLYLTSHEMFTVVNGYRIVNEVIASNAEFDAMEDPQGYIDAVDENWTSATSDDLPEFIETILENNVSLLLRIQLVDHYTTVHSMEIFREIILTNKYGALVAATGFITDFRQDDEAWWQDVQTTGLLITDVAFDESSGIYGVSALATIRDGAGAVIGVAKAVINVLSVAKDIELTALGYETSELKITTPDGRLVFSSRAYVMLQDVSTHPFFEHVAGDRGHFSEREGGVDRLFSYATSMGYLEYDGHGWLMFLTHSEDEVLGPATELQVRILTVAILAIVLGATLSVVLSRSITRPIAALETATRRMAKGRLDQRIAIVNENELGRLAKSFNDMASELETSYSDLDRRVRERTEELENANKKLGVLSSITRHDALNQMTIQRGFLDMAMESTKDAVVSDYLRRVDATAMNLVSFFRFTSDYEEVGINKPEWVNVQEALMSAITGLDLAGKELSTKLENIEVFADPMLPKVLHNLIGNSLKHGKTNTTISLSFSEGPEGLTIVMEDNGVGVPAERKEAIFQKESLTSKRSHGLFLSAEILRITKISIRETGIPGEGARFEILVPMEHYRSVDESRKARPSDT
ncbi:MAG: HAMP domain-containing protein [Thermoplasmata archaeon]|nr:HAMP domain-containing protein [Thermoplasmata archaeon]